MTSQPDLFDVQNPATYPKLIEVCIQQVPVAGREDPETSHEAAKILILSGRRNRQMAGILARLREGSATNRQLNDLAINYRARISDLRAAGFEIRCTRQRLDGVSVYELVSEPEAS